MNYINLSLWQALSERYELKESLPSKLFPRLEAAVEKVNGNVEFEIISGKDEQLQESIRGLVKVKVEIDCQRCLDIMRFEIIAPFRWVLAHSESDADRIGDDDDILIVDEEDPQELVYHLEDELLLGIPFYPMHDESEACEGRIFLENQEEIMVEEEASDNPFSVLTEILKK